MFNILNKNCQPLSRPAVGCFRLPSFLAGEILQPPQKKKKNDNYSSHFYTCLKEMEKNPKRMEEENKTWLRFLYPAIFGCHLKKKKKKKKQ